MNENGGADELKTAAGTPAPVPSAEPEGKVPAEEPNTA